MVCGRREGGEEKLQQLKVLSNHPGLVGFLTGVKPVYSRPQDDFVETPPPSTV
jgi:hypothetical protein